MNKKKSSQVSVKAVLYNSCIIIKIKELMLKIDQELVDEAPHAKSPEGLLVITVSCKLQK